MPWCQTCSRFFNPNTLTQLGECPTCGLNLAPEIQTPTETTTENIITGKTKKIPWHFWMLAGLASIYLGWRLVQGIIALAS